MDYHNPLLNCIADKIEGKAKKGTKSTDYESKLLNALSVLSFAEICKLMRFPREVFVDALSYHWAGSMSCPVGYSEP